MGNKFWVYVNEQSDKAIIHRASCSHCNNGKGREKKKFKSSEVNLNVKWVGPFTKMEAIGRAWYMNKETRKWCGTCARSLNINAELDVH